MEISHTETALTKTMLLPLPWNQNTEPDLSGYRLYHAPEGSTSETIVSLGKVTTHSLSLVDGATERKHQFQLTAVDLRGNESPRTKVVLTTIPAFATPASVPPVDLTPLLLRLSEHDRLLTETRTEVTRQGVILAAVKSEVCASKTASAMRTLLRRAVGGCP